jgi:CubicO group peptidase (beta-lactamase class C family)
MVGEAPAYAQAAGRDGAPGLSANTRGCELATSTPAAEGVDDARLKQLVDSAKATRSDAFVVLKNGRIIAEWYSDSGTPIQTMSATKSIVGLAIARLLHQKQLDSLDQPVWTLYPEWRQGRKRQITVRHLLNHTSGLQDVPSDAPEIEPAPDAIQLALAAELMADPGSNWFYSNKATNLLAGIVQRASGKPLDAYISESLLRPLCINDAPWQFRDRSGNPYGMAGLALRARDLARIGQLMLDDGKWNGQVVLPPALIRESVSASQPFEPRYGLLWWIAPEWSATTVDTSLVRTWTNAGVERDVVAPMESLVGRRFVGAEWRTALDSVFGAPRGSGRGMERLAQATRQRGVPMRRVIVGPSRGYYANGSLGQWLLVLPEERLVIVRQIRRRIDHTQRDTFDGLPSLAHDLLGRGR